MAVVQVMVVILVSAPNSDKCSTILEEHTVSIFRVTEFVQLDAEVMRWKKMSRL
jgi:hypothetical protein